ncbi:MAG TPA: hypothetical protein VFD19_04935, partial [Clostridia bacterium]|nr:hypothetical protein [Clostridia bacterium]
FKYNDTVIAQDTVITLDGSAYCATATWNSVPAGDYTLTASYTAALNDNYVCASSGQISDYSVTKYAQPDFKFVDGTGYTLIEGKISRTYGDNAFSLQIGGQLSDGTVTYFVTNGSDVVTVTADSGEVSILKSGVAVIKALSPSDDTFNEAIASLTIAVAKADQSGFGFADTSVDKTYGDEPFTVTAFGGQGTGEISYVATDGSDVLSVDASGNPVILLKSGTALITATKAADDRYNETTASLTIQVGQVSTSIIEPPIAGDISVVGILSSSTLSGGTGSVAGSFMWTSPDQVISSTGMYEVTFMPDDTMNYASNTCEVPVKVTSLISHSGTGIQFDLSKTGLPDRLTSVSVTLSVVPTDSEIYSALSGLGSSDPAYTSQLLILYDLSLIDQDGNPISDFTGTLTVKIPIQNGMSGDLRVMWYEPSSKTLVDMKTQVEAGYLVFETNHFSYYAVMQLTKIESPSVTVPITGETDSTVLPIPLVVLGILFVCCLLVLTKMRGLKEQ